MKKSKPTSGPALLGPPKLAAHLRGRPKHHGLPTYPDGLIRRARPTNSGPSILVISLPVYIGVDGPYA